MEKNLERECIHWRSALKQKDHEVESQGRANLTENQKYGFKKCYSCDGHNYECPEYSPLATSPKLLMKRMQEDFFKSQN